MNATTAETTFTVAELAARLDGRLIGAGDGIVRGVNALADASATEITFLADTAHARRWPDARAGAAVISEPLLDEAGSRPDGALIAVANAELACVTLLELFAPEPVRPDLGIHPTAVVDPTATVGVDVRIGPGVTVGPRTVIGDRVVLHAGVHLYPDVVVGDASELHSGTVVRERCTLGNRVILHPNVSIGSDGFGYRPAPDGSGLLKVPQIGTVKIGHEVEMGAGCCVDRGKFGATTVGDGTKLDNVVHVGHNTQIGRCCVIAGGTVFAGSVRLGDFVQCGGHTSFSDHVTIGDGAVIGGKSGVMHDMPPGEAWLGVPAGPVKMTLRGWAAIRKLSDSKRRKATGGRGADADPAEARRP